MKKFSKNCHTKESHTSHHYACPKFCLLFPNTSFFLLRPIGPRTVPRSHIHLSSRDFRSSRLLLLSSTVTSTILSGSCLKVTHCHMSLLRRIAVPAPTFNHTAVPLYNIYIKSSMPNRNILSVRKKLFVVF